MDVKTMHFINEIERNRETIASQQAEIERLRAERQQILGVAIGFHDSYKDLRATRDMAKIVSIIHGDTDEQTWQRADMAEWKAYSQQQPEPLQKSLKVRILRVLSSQWQTFEGVVSYIDDFSHPVIRTALSDLEENNLISRDDWKIYKVTAAGRDYLAGLDKPELTDAEIDAHINEQERLHLESIDYGTDDNGQPDFYDDGGYGDYYDLGLLGE